MTHDEYSILAMRTAPEAGKITISDHQRKLLLGVVGLTDEAGEVAGLVKKYVFHSHPLDYSKVVRELGDVLWYLNYLACVCGYTLDDVMRQNIDKLSARYPEGHFSPERSLHRQAGDE